MIALRIVYPTAETAFDVPFSLRLLDILVAVNVVLGVFNLLPIPPLDGSTLLSLVLPPSRQTIVRFLDQYGIFLLLGLLILAPNLLTPSSSAITEALYGLVGLPRSAVAAAAQRPGREARCPDAARWLPSAGCAELPGAAVPPHQRVDPSIRR